MNIKNFLLVGLGGFAGSILRYAVGIWASGRWSGDFPTGTAIVNVMGSFVIGILLASSIKNHSILSLLLITGFCGGFTTFSTFTKENLFLLQSGNFQTLFSYLSLSIIGGLIFCALGYFISSKFI